MTQFEFTHTEDVTSSAVDEVYYNANTKDLAVNLHGAVYVYPNVGQARYENLVSARSVGRAYREVKADHGPSNYLGSERGVQFTRAAVVGQPTAASLGTPKSLTLAPNARVSLGQTTVVNQPVVSNTSTHEVGFVVEGTTNPRTYTVEAKDVHDAVAKLHEAADALGIKVTPQKVVVSLV